MKNLILSFCFIFFYFHSNGQKIASVNQMGISGTSQTDHSEEISKKIATGKSLYFPAGKYIISKTLHLNNNQSIVGDPGKTVFIWKGDEQAKEINAFFQASNVHDFAISNITFMSAVHSRMYALKVLNVMHMRLEGLNCKNCGIVFCGGMWTTDYPLCTEHDNRWLKISNCTAIGCDDPDLAAILLSYCSDWTVENVNVKRFNQGIQWWGGDSDPLKNGQVQNLRKCTNGLIKNCTSTNMQVGGIWGSMGNHIQVINCKVAFCGDVGVDFEGCVNSSAINNKVNYCKNGSLAIFHYCDNILFDHNTVSGSPNNVLAAITNPAQTQENHKIIFTNNTFESKSGIAQIWEKGPASEIFFMNNKLINVVLDFSFNNNKLTTIRSNNFNFQTTLIEQDFVIKAGQNHFKGKLIIDKNIIRTSLPQSEKVFPIVVNQDDFNSEPITYITDNIFSGFRNNLKITWAGMNPGVQGRTYIQSKKPLKIKRIESGKSKSILFINAAKKE